MRTFYTFCAFIFVGLLGFTQTNVDLDISTTDRTTGKKLTGVSVDVYDAGSIIKTIVTPSNGNVRFSLPAGKIYKIEFSKAGKVTRMVNVNTKEIDAELLQGGSSAKAKFEVSLFDEVPGVDYSYVEKNPFTEFYFDGTSNELKYDEIIKSKMDKKIAELLKKSEDQASKVDAMYQDAMSKAAAWESQKKWKEALDKYEEAALLKPNEKEPKEKIKELDWLLKQQNQTDNANKQKEEEYKKLVATADALRDQGKYSEALAKYNEAIRIKDEQYVKDQIIKVNQTIANENSYKKSIDAGETSFSQKKWQDAKISFTDALKFKPGDPTATKRLADIEIKIKEETESAGKKKNYDAKIAEAEQLLAANKLPEARAKFMEAKTIDGTQTYPDVKIKEIDAKIAEANKNKAKTEQYNAAMKAADDLFKLNKLAEAKSKYQEAAKIDPSQSKPAENIAKIDKMLADQEKAKKDKEKADKIASLMKEASTLYAKNDLENAKKKYQDVLSLDDKNVEANTKLAEINAKITANQGEAEKTKRFNDLKAKGIDLMAQKKWSEAKLAFNEAKSIKADVEIDNKLKEIDKSIAEENAKLSADQQYNKILDEAKKLEITNIDGAIVKYKEAQKIKPTDPIPTAKIKELEAKKSNSAAQAEIDKKYAEALKKGDELVAQKKYTEAIKFYNDAGFLKPSEKEPVNKAAEAERLSKEILGDEKTKVYNKLLEAGQKAIDEKNWAKAKEYYNRAVATKNTDPFPKAKLKEIDDLIKAEEDAKKGSLDKEKAYSTKMLDAENAVKTKDYDKAIKLFEEAKSLKPTEILPQKRIDEVKKMRDAEANNSQTEKMYNEYMKNGNDALNSKNYNQALSEFKNALNVKKNDKVAQAKINEVQQLIDNETNSKLSGDYTKLIKQADVFFAQADYISAKEAYEKALNIKNEAYAKKQLSKCIEELKKRKDEEIEYQKVISKADEYFSAKNYDKSKELYKRALTFRPKESYPKDKLKEIDAIQNPIAVIPAGPLNPLGTPTTESLESVNEQLVKAEEIRKQKKKEQIDEKSTTIQNNNISASDKKTEELYSTKNSIVDADKRNSMNYEDGDEIHKNNQAEVENKKSTITESENVANSIKYNENLNTKENIKNVSSEVSTQYVKGDIGYTENAESYKKYDQIIVDQNLKDNTQSYNNNIDSKTRLTNSQVKIDEQVKDDYDSRKQIDDQVKEVNSAIIKNEDFNISKENESSLAVESIVETGNKNSQIKNTEDAKLSGNNNENINVIDQKIKVDEIDKEGKNIVKTYEADKVLTEKQNVIGEIPNTQDENRKGNVQGVKNDDNITQDKTREDYNANVLKRLQTQGDITNTKNDSDILTSEKIADAAKIRTEVERLDKNASISYSEIVLSDDQERLNTKTGVSNISTTVSDDNTEKGKKVDNNISGVKDVSNTLTDDKIKESEQKRIELENAQVALNKISNSEMKFDDKVANSLGSTYPEGVSQEVFENKDEAGLLVSVITRRVVVKSGYGQIYVRTQSLNGITYSKNGEPSSEYVWQRETQDSKLKKNY